MVVNNNILLIRFWKILVISFDKLDFNFNFLYSVNNYYLLQFRFCKFYILTTE